MANLSGEEAKRGNFVAYNRKLGQSRALTLTGLGIGLAIYATFILIIVLVSRCSDMFSPNKKSSFNFYI